MKSFHESGKKSLPNLFIDYDFHFSSCLCWSLRSSKEFINNDAYVWLLSKRLEAEMPLFLYK